MKKSKLSVKLARRLSCRVQTSGGRSAAVFPVSTVESWDIVAEVHRSSRLYSVDSNQKPTFSRRQILASLEEENGPSLSPSSTSTTNVLLTMLYMYLILWIFTFSISDISFSESSSSGDDVFSGACLLRFMSREESASPRYFCNLCAFVNL